MQSACKAPLASCGTMRKSPSALARQASAMGALAV
jgi:hypothetical protein